ncbi:ethanolaminephosphotransferase [Marchantia polymorpha subsp. ruderalis]|uniref:Aminoalcoholphosphotransferase n=2 Tax=Marchantia polymorpha TaxID=3197 RepID=A0AAF6BP82_MARPO|nr:hypothetical protein MARPO_0173s0008 [Marchantia polymorpha]BBN13816.1 hypothetical protein Mp_6g06630 [Marchantia polymorpha subsp. ruderalis]|eukprot:PTQ28105.1 hypothetical protein MARPO_0173s0008 [Marchantia polymorpha]
MGYIGKHGVEALQRYKYSGVDRSYVAKYVLQPFWRSCVNLFPLWMPPNMITLMGFMFVVSSSILSYLYSPNLDQVAPAWVYLMHGTLLFLYQTFDAVDGKQARRTNSSSPLGELFDHGCDALTCAFETMAFGSAVLSGRNSIWFWAIATIPFFGATWESFFTDTLILPEINGPTEGLLLIYSVHFFTAFVGPTWWTLNFRQAVPLLRFIPFIPDMPLNTFIIWGMMICAVVPTVGYNISNVHKVIKARGTSMVSALAMVLPFVALLTGIVTWAWLSPSDILATQPHLVLVGSGFAFGFLVGRLILAHLCDEPKGLKTSMCTALVVLPLGIANALSAKLLGGAPLVNEVVVLLGYCAYTSSLYLHFAVGVIHEITSALGIYCFRLGKKKDIKGN